MATETPSTQPLLRISSDSESSFDAKAPHVSLRELEDGNGSIFASDEEEIVSRPGFWRRLRMSIRRRNAKLRVDEDCGRVRLPDEKTQSKKYRVKRKYAARAFSSFDSSVLDKAQLLDITRDVTPVPCHSHNDYWRRVPLYDALRWGCTGVEADVWLFDEELYVGHSTNALTQDGTFTSMYVDPLVKMLDHKNELGEFATSSDVKNGIFDTEPAQTLVLLVDFKNNGHDIFPVVSQQLDALRQKGYLTYFNGNTTIEGAITVVATGNAPFDLITANSTYRDIFFDAPLDKLDEGSVTTRGGQGTVGTTPTSHFDSTNSYYASVNFGHSIGTLWFGRITEAQRLKIRAQIQSAKERGLKSRYWSAPKFPIGLRNRVWKMLVEEGVGYLNGDDLQGMTRLDWGVKRHWGLIG
ncbi:hypothetical protein J4E93_002246 [Alternaria ventricosa]|uniref:uncharacterized protein n=1 Tax=Alternaria ventricosa TaxID=1187951 RepID=UPI0020C54F24|nr:uncharacterized protein J4E93_002246 [Alternaria ventricosa]KAI4652049.1 hypothetical protein J4E93_002246 [Alternaria ventricosa]